MTAKRVVQNWFLPVCFGVVFVALLIGAEAAFGEPASQIVFTVFLVAGLLGLFWYWRQIALARVDTGVDEISVREGHIDCAGPGGDRSIGLDSLVAIDVVTTGAGPYVDDWFWVLVQSDNEELWIGSETEGVSALNDALKAFPGFSLEEYGKSIRSTDDVRFHVWRRDEAAYLLSQSKGDWG